jgi:tetratricopeptide (TPR) repeat protein
MHGFYSQIVRFFGLIILVSFFQPSPAIATELPIDVVQIQKPADSYDNILDKRKIAIPQAEKDTINKVYKTIKAKKKKDTSTKFVRVSSAKNKNADDNYDEITSVTGLDLKIKTPSEIAVTNKKRIKDAFQAYQIGNYEAAASLYKQVLKRDKKNKEALFGIASTYYNLNQKESAKEKYADLLLIDPNNEMAINNFLALVGEDSPNEALVELEKLRKLKPSYSPIYAQIAFLYTDIGEYARALEYINEAIKLSPRSIMYRYNLAVIKDKIGDKSEALAIYREVVKNKAAMGHLLVPTGEIERRIQFLES